MGSRNLPTTAGASDGDVLTVDSTADFGASWQTPSGGGGGGGGPSPGGTVVDERVLDHSASSAGAASTYSRSDHTHGTPAMPSASDVGAVAVGASAGGDLSGTYPSPSISSSVITTAARTVLDDTTVAAMLATLGGAPTSRTISTTAPLQGGGSLAADRTLTVDNATTGAVGVVKLAGQLGGSATSPTVTGVTETSGPTALALGSVPDGYFVQRSGSSLVGAAGTLIGATHKRYDPDLPYASATFVTPTQEFSSSQSQGGWTNSWDLGSISPSVSIGPGGLEISTTATGAALGGVYHSTFPSGDFCVAMKYSLIGGGTAAACGLGFMQGTGSTDDVFFVGSYHAGYSSPDTRQWMSYFTAYNTPGADIQYFNTGQPMYLVVRYQASGHKATTWLGPSPDDLKLVDLDRTLANAATKLGLLIRGVSGAARHTRGRVEFLRVIADTYDGSGTTVPPRLMGALVADY